MGLMVVSPRLLPALSGVVAATLGLAAALGASFAGSRRHRNRSGTIPIPDDLEIPRNRRASSFSKATSRLRAMVTGGGTPDRSSAAGARATGSLRMLLAATPPRGNQGSWGSLHRGVSMSEGLTGESSRPKLSLTSSGSSRGEQSSSDGGQIDQESSGGDLVGPGVTVGLNGEDRMKGVPQLEALRGNAKSEESSLRNGAIAGGKVNGDGRTEEHKCGADENVGDAYQERERRRLRANAFAIVVYASGER